MGIDAKKILVTANILLLVAILVSVRGALYKKKIIIELEHNYEPTQLIHVINQRFNLEQKKAITLLYVFNVLPTESQLEDINKLADKYSSEIDTLVLFCKRFKTNMEMIFRYAFIDNYIIPKDYKNIPYSENYCLILDDNNKVAYLDRNMAFSDVAYILRKAIYKNMNHQDFALSDNFLYEKIRDRIKQGNLRLFDMSKGAIVYIESLQNKRIYFVHAPCSTCQLKSLLPKLATISFISKEEEIVIFSFYANEHELKQMIEENHIGKDNLFIDSEDNFDLFRFITNEKNSPLVIEPQASE
jgi:hypothetical protein